MLFKFVTKAIVALHNFLMYKSQANSNENQYFPPNDVNSDGVQGLIPGQWRAEESSILGLRDVDRFGSNNYLKMLN